MGSPLIDDFLTGDSKAIRDLANNEAILVGFLTLVKEIDDMPDMEPRFYETSRSLYQVTALRASDETLLASLGAFFGKPQKAAGKSLPVGLRFDPVVKHLGGARKDQTLFLKKLKTGAFYGALWPWQMDPQKVEVHLGFFSSSISDVDYQRLEGLLKKILSRQKIETVSGGVGGEIHGISLPSFLQMSEMEEATYTLRVASGSRVGYLYIDGGRLIAARYDELTGNDAAYRIISWDKASIQIEPAEPERVREIREPLMHVMMESLKIKDEAGEEEAPSETILAEQPPAGEASGPRGTPGQGASPPSAEPPESLASTPVVPPPPPPVAPARTDTAAPLEPFDKPVDHAVGKQGRMGRRARLLLFLGILALVVVAVSVGVPWFMQYQASRRYDQLVADLAASKELDAQIVRMMQYLKAHPEDVHRDALETRLEAASREMEERDYEKTVLDVSRLSVDEKYENKALSLYTAFLAKYPDSRYAKQIQEAIGGIRQLLGSAYFEALKKRPPADFMERYAAYQAYLDQFPDSNERQAIVGMIDELADAYADAIAHQATSCDEKAHWDSCVAECDRFLSVLADKPAAERVRQLRATLLDKQELADLIVEASKVADDWNKARHVYLDYLEKRPDTTQRAAIEARIAEFNTEVERKARWDKTAAFANDARQDIHARIKRLERFLASPDAGPYAAAARELRQRLEPERQRVLQDQELAKARQQALARQQAEAARQEKALQRISRLRDQAARQLRPVAGRFKDNGDGTVFDRKTGLTWCLLDSKMETGTCMKYRDAQAYVGHLTTGGYSDWRLPNAGELATLYKNAPFFPGSGSAWYWSSESFARGYHWVVDVVTTTPETVFTRVSKSEENCGAVRAVRH